MYCGEKIRDCEILENKEAVKCGGCDANIWEGVVRIRLVVNGGEDTVNLCNSNCYEKYRYLTDQSVDQE